MHRTSAGLCVAAVLAFGAAAGAQTTTTATGQGTPGEVRSGREVTVTGCLVRGTDGRYTLMSAMAEPMARNTTTGTSGTTSAATEPVGSGTTRPAGLIAWRLSGGSDLDKHVGHRIQVTGKTSGDASAPAEPPSSTTATDTTTTTDSNRPELDVQAIKMIATGCS